MDPRPLTADQPLPPPPRDVRFAAAFGRRAILGLIGGLLVLAGAAVMVSLLALGSGLPFDDHALDSECVTTNGEIVRREPTGAHTPAGNIVRFTFRFRVGEQTYEGECHAIEGAVPAGSRHAVEFLRGEPGVSRLQGTTRAVPGLVPWSAGVILCGAGFLLVLLWLRAGVAQRQLLREGDAVPGEVQSARRVAFVNPPQLAVEFTFRDRERRECKGRQWCAAKSALGQALLAGARAVHVVHDPAHPARSCLVSRECFEPAHGAG